MSKTKEEEKEYILGLLSKAKEMKLSVKEIGRGLLHNIDEQKDAEQPKEFRDYLGSTYLNFTHVESELSELEENLQEALYKLL